MKNENSRSPQQHWLARVPETQNGSQVVDDMLGVLMSFFSQAKQSHNRKKSMSATALGRTVLGASVPIVRFIPVFTTAQLAARWQKDRQMRKLINWPPGAAPNGDCARSVTYHLLRSFECCSKISSSQCFA